jgi:PBSX family phage terminase large subunit
MPESFYLMLTSRMSPAGARLYATCNPSHPYHYVKKDIIDNAELRKAGMVKVLHFDLDDNPNLSKETRAGYERQYKGMFYLRYIKGLWVIAEGAIYRDVWDEGDVAAGGTDEGIFYSDATLPIGLFHRGGHQAHYIGCDYGTHNPFVLLDCWDDGDTVWVEKEFYYDSVEERAQKTNTQYLHDVVDFMGDYGDAELIVDPSAAAFKLELTMAGIWVTDAVNDVIPGIQKVSSLLARRKIRINKLNCPKLCMEMQIYAWNPKAAARGEEEPIKTNDHAPDALRYPVETKILDYRLAA